MKKIWGFFTTTITIAIIIAVAYGIFLLLSNFLNRISSINESIIAAFVAALTAVFGYWYTQRQINFRNTLEAHRPKKVEVYGVFMDILEDALNSVKNKEKEKITPSNISDKLQKKFFKLNRGLIIWGSPKTIKAWHNFRLGSKESSSNHEPLFLMDAILRSIREDLGNSNFGLKEGDLIKIFLSDPEELDNKK
ncbi:MAG: hypothetical protein GY755_03540 [Chloroflexi bacterium]|nr:hypothetical protein [Chloroflexota bacterium]